eukprot:snap_masked-scaffold_12-processed-gene-1.43-mRNA-1 protein AED:0.02 eAED:0.02 QI:0/-1/0/1/-1/1/1/0/139
MDLNTKLNQAVQETINSLAKSTIIPVRKEAFLCSAKCCDTASSNMEGFQNCVQQCEQKTSRVEQTLSQELNAFQDRIQRCAMDCQDRAKDKMPSDPSKATPELVDRLNGEIKTCADQCMKQGLASLKLLEKRVEQSKNF